MIYTLPNAKQSGGGQARVSKGNARDGYMVTSEHSREAELRRTVSDTSFGSHQALRIHKNNLCARVGLIQFAIP